MILALLACHDKPATSWPVDSGECVESAWYPDLDSDGFGAGLPVESCRAPHDHVASSTDCDDADASVFPGAEEAAYDGIDQDCDGSDLDDVDGDGSPLDADCDDDDPDRSPGFDEICDDAIDNDGDDEVDYDCQFFGGVAPGGPAAVIYGEVETVECCGSEAGYFLHGDDFNQDGVGDLVMWSESDGTEFKLMYGPFSGESDTSAAQGSFNDHAVYRDLVKFVSGGVDGGALPLFIGEPYGAGERNSGLVVGYNDVEGWHGTDGYDFALSGRNLDAFGAHIVLGDIDGDGVSDLVGGSPHAGLSEDTLRGEIAVAFGPVDGDAVVSCGDSPGLRQGEYGDLGEAFAIRDLDADGQVDLVALAGQSQNADGSGNPHLYVATGPVTECVLVEDADSMVAFEDISSFESEYLEKPTAVQVVDHNSDGAPDVLVSGQVGFEGGGSGAEVRAYVFDGPLADASTSGHAAATIGTVGDGWERLVAEPLGDIDGDGMDDIAFGVTEYRESDTAGAVYLIFGPLSGTYQREEDAFGILRGDVEPFESCETEGCEHPGSLFGWSLVGGDDYTGDGHPDLVIGSPGFEYDLGTNDKGPGAVYVYSGR